MHAIKILPRVTSRPTRHSSFVREFLMPQAWRSAVAASFETARHHPTSERELERPPLRARYLRRLLVAQPFAVIAVLMLSQLGKLSGRGDPIGLLVVAIGLLLAAWLINSSLALRRLFMPLRSEIVMVLEIWYLRRLGRHEQWMRIANDEGEVSRVRAVPAVNVGVGWIGVANWSDELRRFVPIG